MTTVRLVGWSRGLNTVHLIKLVRTSADVPLNEALASVNRLVSGETVELRIDSLQTAQKLAAEACELGVRVECEAC